jgi:hypothetical protein
MLFFRNASGGSMLVAGSLIAEQSEFLSQQLGKEKQKWILQG